MHCIIDQTEEKHSVFIDNNARMIGVRELAWSLDRISSHGISYVHAC